jgi:hypothetical protein
MKAATVIGMLGVFLALLVLWPNLVHEPLHVLALRLQGISGHVNGDWHLPAHPSTTREGQIVSIWGGLLFLLLPSIVSVCVIIVLLLTQPNVWTHGVLGTYLVFDIIINVLGYRSPASDFRFLQVVSVSPMVIIVPVVVAGVVLIGKTVFAVQRAEVQDGTKCV